MCKLQAREDETFLLEVILVLKPSSSCGAWRQNTPLPAANSSWGSPVEGLSKCGIQNLRMPEHALRVLTVCTSLNFHPGCLVSCPCLHSALLWGNFTGSLLVIAPHNQSHVWMSPVSDMPAAHVWVSACLTVLKRSIKIASLRFLLYCYHCLLSFPTTRPMIHVFRSAWLK